MYLRNSDEACRTANCYNTAGHDVMRAACLRMSLTRSLRATHPFAMERLVLSFSVIASFLCTSTETGLSVRSEKIRAR
jgi:hypothetical protein